MKSIENLVRENILNLTAYSSARKEFSGIDGVFLDANENPFGDKNRYPDPYQKILKKELSAIKNVPIDSIFIGNGSDEVIDLAFRIFCTPGVDKAMTFSPTYGMYDVSAGINDIELLKIPLKNNFQMDVKSVEPFLKNKELKLIFICSPNNPTGNLLNEEDILFILDNFKGIVLIDEAYIDFSSSNSWSEKINQYPNLIILQTFSKAWGLANSRVGFAFSSSYIIHLFNKIKPPYNVSGLNQNSAVSALQNIENFNKNLQTILQQKEWLKKELSQLEIIQKIYPSDANFLLVEVENADFIYHELVVRGIIVRNRNNIIRNSIRISVGNASENQKLINALKEII